MTTPGRRRLEHISVMINQWANKQLRDPKNLEKGDNWAECGWAYLRERTHEEVDELFDRLEEEPHTNEDLTLVWEEAGDVENFLRMALDKGGFFANRMKVVRSSGRDSESGS